MPPRDKLPSKKVLHEYFRYEDGELFWKVASYGRSPDKPAGNTSVLGYRRVKLRQQLMFLHRVIWKMHYGTEPVYLDHIDRNRLNNRIENLREATAHENLTNSGIRKNNTSGFIGAAYSNQHERWYAHVRIPGNRFRSGMVGTAKEAGKVYDAMLELLCRERAERNFADKKPTHKYLKLAYTSLSPHRKKIKDTLGVIVHAPVKSK